MVTNSSLDIQLNEERRGICYLNFLKVGRKEIQEAWSPVIGQKKLYENHAVEGFVQLGITYPLIEAFFFSLLLSSFFFFSFLFFRIRVILITISLPPSLFFKDHPSCQPRGMRIQVCDSFPPPISGIAVSRGEQNGRGLFCHHQLR